MIMEKYDIYISFLLIARKIAIRTIIFVVKNNCIFPCGGSTGAESRGAVALSSGGSFRSHLRPILGR
jgi:hypothetical protein